ncbi:hypothetical protein BO70DRAFT_358429 [Aspergillus heteromorphus CBS 117.55]|uniref:Uncharacterized protein n=1 Tax=Aspergillus heteromorphus CBS 117.55 TaxID=1448321 RepID=A0A317WYC8_9EURO|nr:uncharacterized protein BO70DRAFT_358429 [Aspergillus heteromorphus CBS 117.55]PWY90985.1 hypothetical protein BO70DRAFT_358429 [Aspergillus heteromorphus CBS 117.55]
MLIYVGKLNYSPYASDEIIAVVFRDNVQVGDRVSVILQWSKDGSGHVKANSSNDGTVNKVNASSTSERDIEFFNHEKESTYYWYKGKISNTKLTLTMVNKSGQEVAKNIELHLSFF